MKTLPDRLTVIFDAILNEARNNLEFAAKLECALVGETSDKPTIKNSPPAGRSTTAPPRRLNRRAKAVVDPFELLSVGEHHLRSELAKLDLEQIKDIVAEHGMDTSRLALKWKSRERLIDFIVTTVVARNRKGDVFRDGGGNAGGAGRDNKINVHYKNCTPEDILCLRRFESEIQKAMPTVLGLMMDACWEADASAKSQLYFRLFVLNQPEKTIVEFGKAYLEKVSSDDFYHELEKAGFTRSFTPKSNQ